MHEQVFCGEKVGLVGTWLAMSPRQTHQKVGVLNVLLHRVR